MSMEPDPRTSAEALQDEYGLPIKDLLEVLWRRLWVIVSVAVVLTVVTVVFSFAQTSVYEASIQILVGQEQGIISESPNSAQGLEKLTGTVAELVDTRPVAQAVIQRLDLQMPPEVFLENLEVEQVANTQTIRVSYKDPSPERAQRIINTVGDVFSEQVSEVSSSASAITATVWERAVAPEAPVSPNPARNGLLALVLGGMLGVGLAFLLDRLDDRWRSQEEVEQVSGVPNFGVIREFEASKSKKEDPPGSLPLASPGSSKLPQRSRKARRTRREKKRGLLSWLVLKRRVSWLVFDWRGGRRGRKRGTTPPRAW